ncbi:MAG TPA: hypothetical protein ENK10_09220 [Acidobacteria bacterium]|nr:hypothetical protein [Acidobacteriota bacterium]
MLTRQQHLDAFLALVKAANTGVPDDEVDVWDGEDLTLNPDAAFPHIAVSLDRISNGPPLEAGADTHEATYLYDVLVFTETDDFGDGQTRALTILDALEAHLTTSSIDGRRVRMVGDEELMAAHRGRYCYAQSYAVPALVSR